MEQSEQINSKKSFRLHDKLFSHYIGMLISVLLGNQRAKHGVMIQSGLLLAAVDGLCMEIGSSCFSTAICFERRSVGTGTILGRNWKKRGSFCLFCVHLFFHLVSNQIKNQFIIPKYCCSCKWEENCIAIQHSLGLLFR